MNADAAADIKELSGTLESIEAVSDLPALRTEIADLEDQAGQPDLWSDQEAAQKVTSRLAHAQGQLRRLEDLRRRLDDLPVLYELAEDEGDASAIADADADRTKLREEISALEVRTLLSGEYDEREALVTIRSEAGGVDAADFAEMLMRMYLRWAEKHGYATDVYDVSYAEEAGIKSATFQVHAPFAYGTLSVEQGTHRLVRISPFDNQGRRQTSFAGVEVAPVVEATDHVDIDEKDLRVDVYRSSGPGGQGVNTTDSAVRHHPPAHRHRRLLPERAQPDPEPGVGHAGAAGQAAGAAPPGGAGRCWTRSRTRARPGATRCAPTCCTRTRW